ncbi:MAG: helix-turn-helix domain-containing protein [Thermoanaerobaculia bacterium]
MRPALTEEEKEFFRDFGSRLAELRKARGLTQVQLAERLEITQQQLASYEIGRRRVPVSLLAPLADALSASVEELLGAEPKSKKRGPAPKLERHLERISQLPRARQRFVLQVLDSVLQQEAR